MEDEVLGSNAYRKLRDGTTDMRLSVDVVA
jgi:hypothetical protein